MQPQRENGTVTPVTPLSPLWHGPLLKLGCWGISASQLEAVAARTGDSALALLAEKENPPAQTGGLRDGRSCLKAGYFSHHTADHLRLEPEAQLE